MGTAYASSAFDVAAGSITTLLGYKVAGGTILRATSANGNVIISPPGTGGAIYFYSKGSGDNSVVSAIANNGNVGIGTDSPSYKLDVSGTLGVTGASTLTGNITAGGDIYLSNAKYIRANNSSGTAEQLMGMNGSNQLLIGYGHRTSGSTILYGLSVTLSTNGTSRLYVLSSGNVGIANSSPSEKLHVTGNILASGEVTASSDERLKTIVGDGNLDLRYIANAPNILFKWNNGQDDKVHGGSLAQYFLHGAKHFVLGNDKDYYSLNYGALATSMAISIAKEVVKHEDEIETLKKVITDQAVEIGSLKARVAELEERRIA